MSARRVDRRESRRGEYRRTGAARGREIGATAKRAPSVEGAIVRVLARGLTILRAFTPGNDWRSNHEIATATGLPRPTVSRLTANLTDLGYLNYSVERAQYRLGAAALTLGYAALGRLDVRVLAQPLLQELADREDAHVVLASRDGLAMVCAEVFHSRHSILTLRVAVGSRLALPFSAMGRALFGAVTPAARATLVREISRRYRSRWPSLAPELEAAATQMAGQGFYVSLGSLERGVNGVAVMLDEPGAPNAYSIGLAGPAFRFPEERLQRETGPRLLALKRRIEQQLDATSHLAGAAVA